MSNTPTISVCMPVYNGERYLAEAIESILGQTYTDFELLIQDDGSTDGAADVLAKYAALDARVMPERQANGGIVSALNALLDRAQGEFIARMDGDDVSLPDRFARQLAYLREHPDCVAVGSAAEVIDQDGDPITRWFTDTTHEQIDAGNLVVDKGASLCHPSVMMRRRIVLELGKYTHGVVIHEDRDLWLRLAEHGRLASIAEPLIQYRTHTSNISNTGGERARKAGVEVIRRAYERRGLPVPDLRLAPLPENRDEPGVPHARLGWMALGNGYVETARKHARRLVAAQPFSPESWKLLLCSLRGR